MSPEKRVWAASLLSAVLLVAYAQFLTRSAGSAKPGQLAPPQQSVQIPQQASAVPALKPDEETITIESRALRLEIGKTTRTVRAAVLKEFQNVAEKTPLRFSTNAGVLRLGPGDDRGEWVLEEQSGRRAAWRGLGQNGQTQEFIIELAEVLPIFTATLKLANPSATETRTIPVKTVASWSRGDVVSGRYNMLEAVFRAEKTGSWQRTHLRYLEGAREPKPVPRRTSMATLSERFFCQAIRLDQHAEQQASVLPSERGMIAMQIDSLLRVAPTSSADYSVEAYVGPRDFFHLRNAGFEAAFSLGFLAHIGLILLLFLKGIASVVHNYGVATILLAGLVTAILSPFTMLSFRSMKKLQELQPKMDHLKKKYAHDTQRMNQEMFALFREHRVSPLSGCLPVLLQMPVFFALWTAISHAVELRGRSFLWVHDLSLPDRVAKLPFGYELNLLPILMACAMFLQTRLSQSKAPSISAQPQFSGPLMAILFGVMFYQVPAGLVLYWLTNSLSTILWYKLARIS